MTPAERTRLLLLAASAGTEATLRRALFDWAMEGVEADTPAQAPKGRPGIDFPPWQMPLAPADHQDMDRQAADTSANPEKLAAEVNTKVRQLPDIWEGVDRLVASPQAPETACQDSGVIRDLVLLLAVQRVGELTELLSPSWPNGPSRHQCRVKRDALAAAVQRVQSTSRPSPEGRR